MQKGSFPQKKKKYGCKVDSFTWNLPSIISVSELKSLTTSLVISITEGCLGNNLLAIIWSSNSAQF